MQEWLQPLTTFEERSIVDAWQGSEYAQGSQYVGVLNMPLDLNMPAFWIYLGSEFASGSQFAGVLNMSDLHEVLNVPE